MKMGADEPSARTNLMLGGNTNAPDAFCHTRLNHADFAICTKATPLLWEINFFAHGVTFE